jgi:nucleotide-binding universal stress UspA family protein
MKLDAKKILVAMDLNAICKNSVGEVFKNGDFSDSHISFVHIFEVHQYFNDFTPYSYPPEDQIGTIKKEVENHLSNFANEVFPKDKMPAEVSTLCSFNSDPKEGMLDYLNDHQFDFMIVVAQNKKGLGAIFSSSFAQAMCHLTSTSVLVLKDESASSK